MHAPARRILVVDDDDDAALSLATLLRLDGNEAHVARDGLEALQIAEQQRPDIILLDVSMPKLSGLDVCRQIRDQPWGKGMLIIALTGWGDSRTRQSAREVGFDAYLVKPVDFTDLIRMFDEIG